MEKIKFIKEGYEPFLTIGEYEVVGFSDDEPIIIDNGGTKLRLNKPEDYIIIK